MAHLHLDTAFQYARDYGNSLLNGSLGGLPRVYWWRVDPAECTLEGGDRARCVLYQWEEALAPGGGIERTISRTAVFAIWLEGTVYTRRTQALDLFNAFDGRGPFHVVCSDSRPDAGRCT